MWRLKLYVIRKDIFIRILKLPECWEKIVNQHGDIYVFVFVYHSNQCLKTPQDLLSQPNSWNNFCFLILPPTDWKIVNIMQLSKLKSIWATHVLHLKRFATNQNNISVLKSINMMVTTVPLNNNTINSNELEAYIIIQVLIIPDRNYDRYCVNWTKTWAVRVTKYATYANCSLKVNIFW